eukprot:gnl/Spiro4/11826_TR6244_c0_g1_i1.p1 gnl/Spiro4/11826_TR6244_c0_g1~~gnl/Spiro4/11826_TR6244_c0_g1_i1.p1  ORF type:complete len:326 (-),score=84.15 gnl/Spiro4/11826_TR6244_c0_g1_i1:121-1032(-)
MGSCFVAGYTEYSTKLLTTAENANTVKDKQLETANGLKKAPAAAATSTRTATAATAAGTKTTAAGTRTATTTTTTSVAAASQPQVILQAKQALAQAQQDLAAKKKRLEDLQAAKDSEAAKANVEYKASLSAFQTLVDRIDAGLELQSKSRRDVVALVHDYSALNKNFDTTATASNIRQYLYTCDKTEKESREKSIIRQLEETERQRTKDFNTSVANVTKQSEGDLKSIFDENFQKRQALDKHKAELDKFNKFFETFKTWKHDTVEENERLQEEIKRFMALKSRSRKLEVVLHGHEQDALNKSH